jgi:hypothetical protein
MLLHQKHTFDVSLILFGAAQQMMDGLDFDLDQAGETRRVTTQNELMHNLMIPLIS